MHAIMVCHDDNSGRENVVGTCSSTAAGATRDMIASRPGLGVQHSSHTALLYHAGRSASFNRILIMILQYATLLTNSPLNHSTDVAMFPDASPARFTVTAVQIRAYNYTLTISKLPQTLPRSTARHIYQSLAFLFTCTCSRKRSPAPSVMR